MSSARMHEIPTSANPLHEPLAPGEREVFFEHSFRQMVALERKRSERTQEPFLLMLVDVTENPDSAIGHKVLDRIMSVLINASRETDIVGWYRQGETLGVMFTELLTSDKNLVLNTILGRVSALLRDELKGGDYDRLNISFHFFPEEWDHAGPEGPNDATLYAASTNARNPGRARLMIKRSLDIAVSGAVLLLLAPLYLAIALAIKLTSDGPVLCRQQRVGRYGRLFTAFKFRSLKSNCKQRGESRMTTTGVWLRRTGLDELPKIFNVLKGDMSLVGPRPPVPYELAAYEPSHRRRILEAKPGITGLWQVASGAVKFDDMVRLDLRYATSWSLWMDIKILLRTPLAVLKSAGAH